MPDFDWSKPKIEASQLVAAGELSQDEIAAKVDCTRDTLYRWRKHPEFAARVESLVEDMKASYRRLAISHPERRWGRLNRDWLRLQRVVEARAADPSMAGVPGGDTGLMVRNVKGVGSGEDFEVIDLYEVDTGLLRELRDIEKQAAQELGQWADRQEISGPDKGAIPVGFQESLLKAYGKRKAATGDDVDRNRDRDP